MTLSLRNLAFAGALTVAAVFGGFAGAKSQSLVLVVGIFLAAVTINWLRVTGRPITVWLISIGALLFLNNGAGASVGQIAYGIALFLMTVIAIVDRLRSETKDQPSHVRGFLGTAVVVVACSALVGANADHGRLSVVSALMPYAIMMSGIVTALYLRPRVTAQHVNEIVWVVGLLALALSTISWVQRRGFSDSTVDVPGGSSKFLIFPLVVLGLLYLRSGRKILGAIPISLFLTSSLLIGSRLAVVGGLLGCCLIWAAEGRWRTMLRTSVAAVAVAGGGVFGFIQTLAPGPVRDNFIDRLSYMASSVTGSAHLSTDDSAQLRQGATTAAWNVIHTHPWFGAGPGVTISHYGVSGGHVVFVSGTALDTPLMTLAKIGILGTIALSALAILMLTSTGTGRTVARPGVYFLVLTAMQVPLGSPLEDTGFGVGILLIVLLTATDPCVVAPAIVPGIQPGAADNYRPSRAISVEVPRVSITVGLRH